MDANSDDEALVEVNTAASQLAIYLWFGGLAWTAFVSKSAPTVHPLEWLLLVVVGMYMVSICVAMPLALVAKFLTKLIWKRRYAPFHIHNVMGIIGAIVAFLLAAPVARFVAAIW